MTPNCVVTASRKKQYLLSQARSQEFAIRGLFRRCKIKLDQFTFGIGAVWCPKLNEDQKKGLRPGWDRFFAKFLVSPKVKLVTFSLLLSLLVQKSVSKVLKTGYFAYSACQSGGGA